jgi:hypothetical protein
MLLDDFLPDYDFTEVHSIRIKADAETAFRAVMEITPTEISGIMRLLFFLRSLPERAVGRQGMTMNNSEPLLSYMLKNGFTKIAENEPYEVVFGMIAPGNIGRVWKKSSDLEIVAADVREFFALDNPDYIQVVANLLVEDARKPGFVIVRTESRSRALSPQARKNFTPYWRVIRPFSGLIRMVWLRGIKRRAERGSAEVT